eukprot:Skav224092  [mRNA]  locus=scaffold4565:20858:22852:- [translate_table: standard]
MRAMQVRSYGILGSSNQGKKVDPPNQDTILVDPAGLRYISEGPSGAAGAAGANYKWLEINKAKSFPEDVKEAITEECQAKYHAYAEGKKKCIHVVGPDFRKTSDDKDFTMDDAVEKLALAYGNVFEEFCTVGMREGIRRMRLLPISGGIFSGPFKEDLPLMTARAVRAAYERLSEDKKQHIMDSNVEMCVFMESEFDMFASAFGQLPEASISEKHAVSVPFKPATSGTEGAASEEKPPSGRCDTAQPVHDPPVAGTVRQALSPDSQHCAVETRATLPVREPASKEPVVIRHSLQPRPAQAALESPNTMPTQDLSTLLLETPKFGSDMPNAQPRIGRAGSLPDPRMRPRISILKKAKTESFATSKVLRFSEEVDIRDISPCSPGSPVKQHMDTMQCLHHYHHMQRRAAAAKAAGHSARPSANLKLPIQMVGGHGDRDMLQRGRSHSMSLLPDVPSPLHSEEVHDQSHASGEQPDAFKVKIEQQSRPHEMQKGSSRSQASQASGFLIWKEPGACGSDHSLPTIQENSTGNGCEGEERFHKPIATTVTQYLYHMRPSSGPQNSQNVQSDQSASQPPLRMQADPPVLQTTVNCTKELSEMYTRHCRSRGSHHRSGKSYGPQREQTAPPSAYPGSPENIPTSQRAHCNVLTVTLANVTCVLSCLAMVGG